MVKYFFILNKILIVFVVSSFIYFCFKLFSPLRKIDKLVVINNQVEDSALPKSFVSVPIKPYSHYAGQLQKRDIFQFLEDKPAAPKKVKVKKAVKVPVKVLPRALPLIKSLKLVGVVLDKNSEAIVENPKKNETLFLRKGDEFEGAIVEGISEGKIIFLYAGSQVELVQ